MKLEFSRQIFEECSNIKFQGKKSVQWEPSCSMRTDRQTVGQTDINMTKLTDAFCNFANAPKKHRIVPQCFFYRSDIFLFLLTALLYKPDVFKICGHRHWTPRQQIEFCCTPSRGLRSTNSVLTVNYSCISKRLNLNAYISIN
jgi:hypothetical protein